MNQSEKVWVELEVLKGANGIYTFRGLMLLDDLNAWACGRLLKTCVLLEKAYWIVNETHDADTNRFHLTYRVLGKDEGQYHNCSGVVYIRADTILLAYILKDGAEREIYDDLLP